MRIVHVIGKLPDGISAQKIFSDSVVFDPANFLDNLFKDFQNLNAKLKFFQNNAATIAIVCGANFGCNPQSANAVAALDTYHLTIIAKSINPIFLASCSLDLQKRLIQLSNIDDFYQNINDGDIVVDDDTQIQTFMVINKHGPGSEDTQN